jgi:protoporphyrinogen/coproporphyrinogen III oxidase
VLVTLAYPERPLDGSGFLVPRVDGRLLTACSWFTTKWPDTAHPGRVIVRASAGRFRDERALEMHDDELVARVHDELSEAMGLTDAPTEVRISRWHRAFPQFAPGHLDRMAAAERALPLDLAIAGASVRGVGIPTCIGTARAAAERLNAKSPRRSAGG